MKSRRSRLLRTAGTIAASATGLIYAAYRKDIEAARHRLENDSQVINAAHQQIEFAESGNGPAMLVIHGAGGGFDQGLDLARAFLGDENRFIAPSRFGYLGTPLPADASAEAQADAYLRLLDALKLDRVPVVAVSAGAPSAMRFCLKHP
ncbi:MAG: alpha/beta fold hydrolase, partial [Thermoanaerobaculia bacterium]